jgi:5-methylcytosine-specific restriction endonuclease McrA
LKAVLAKSGGRKHAAYILRMQNERPLQSVPDDELLHRLPQVLAQSRRSEVDIVTLIAEIDERRLYAREACPSMYVYCTQVLHLSEAEAYLRITTGRAARAHPMLLDMLGDGRLHLSGIVKLAPHLTPENRDELLNRACHLSKREIEELLAELFPRPDVPTTVRKLPERRASSPAPPEPQLRPDRVEPPPVSAPPATFSFQPLAPARYKVQFTAGAELQEKLERLRSLMRSQVPDGDLATIIEQAVTEKLERLEARRFAKTQKPRKSLSDTDTSARSRYIPAVVRRTVSERDGRQCHYRNEQGRQCNERVALEHHHVYPYGFGGDHSPSHLRLLCRAHNRLIAEHDYGKATIAEKSAVRPSHLGNESREPSGLAARRLPFEP